MHSFSLAPTMPDHSRMTMERLRAWHDAEPAVVVEYFGGFFDYADGIYPIPYGETSPAADGHEGGVLSWWDDESRCRRLAIFGNWRDCQAEFREYLALQLRGMA